MRTRLSFGLLAVLLALSSYSQPAATVCTKCNSTSNATALLGVLDRLHAKMFATHLLSLVGSFVDIHSITFSSNHISKNRRAKNNNAGVEDCERFLGTNDFYWNNSNTGFFECCRRMVHLDFSETRLSGWGAKHPNSVKGYYCVGHCTRYGGYAFGTQSGDESFYSELMNAHAGSLGLSPCCAPVRFDPLTVTVRHGM
uniref:TGF_BETA_2 domain-containing protein n=1 Tax=Ascaris lumbricoides TaxID=6252 RepID=A0A0M3HSI5_ASCLU